MRIPEILRFEDAVMPEWNYYCWSFGVIFSILAALAIYRKSPI